MSPLVRVVLIATGAAVVGVVLYQQFVATGDDQSWEVLAGVAHSESVEQLEAARDQASNGPAGPWIEYQLAMRLYDLGGSENLERSRQVAQSALDKHPEHVTSPWLRQLIDAIGTYKQVPAPQ